MKIADAYFDGGFGRRIAAPQGVVMPDNSGAEAIGNAGQRLAGSIQGVSDQLLEEQGRLDMYRTQQNISERDRLAREEEAEFKRLDREKQKSVAMTALVDHENTLNEVVEEIRKDPKIPTEQYQDIFRQQAENVKASFFKQVPEEFQYAFGPTFDEHVNRANQTLGAIITKETQDTIKANLVNMMDGLAKSGKSVREMRAILDETPEETWRAAGYGPDDRAKQIGTFLEQATETELLNRMNSAGEKKEPDQLKALMTELHATNEDGSYQNYQDMDPKARETYYHTAKSRLNQLQAEAERARKERERERKDAARDAYDLYKESKEGLTPLSVKEEAQLLRRMQGTIYYDRARNVQKRTSDIGFVLEKVKQDPLTFGAASMGVSVPPLDPRTPQNWAAQLQQRGQVAGKIKGKYGLSSLPILTNQEAGGLVDLLKMQSPQGIVQTVQGLRNTGMRGDTLNRISAQFAARDPGLGAVVGLVAAGKDTTALHVATGLQLIQGDKKTVQIDKLTAGGMQTRFDKYLGDALGHMPQLRSTMFDAATAAYVSLQAQSGRVGEFDRKLFDQATREVVGDTVKINGRHVVIPDGMTEGRFKDFFKRIGPEQVKQYGGVAGYDDARAAAAIRDDAQLFEVSSGRYRVAIDGKYLMTADGKQPLTLEIGVHDGSGF